MAHGNVETIADLPCANSIQLPIAGAVMMPVTFTGRFTQTFLDNPEVGTHTAGSGLYLAVRNAGKARSWSFRHRGHRLTIGSASRVSLANAQAQVRRYRDRLAQGEDLFARNVDEEKKTETLREAVEAHYA